MPGVIFIPSNFTRFMVADEVFSMVLVFRPEEELKPSHSCSSALEEDEGFGDWSHRTENREVSEEWRSRRRTPPTLLQKTETGEGQQQEDEEEEEEVCKLREALQRTPEVKTVYYNVLLQGNN